MNNQNLSWDLPPGVSLNDIDPLKKCPQCAETINDDATICLNCQFNLESYNDIMKDDKNE